MTTMLKNKGTGEVVSTEYSLSGAYYPWEIIRDSRSENVVYKLLKSIDEEMKGTEHAEGS